MKIIKVRFLESTLLYAFLVALTSMVALFLMVHQLSISQKEARALFEEAQWGYEILRNFVLKFDPSQRDYALRGVMIAIHGINLLLVYALGRKILRYRLDALVCLIIFALIPGVNLLGLFVNNGGVILTVCLLFCLVLTHFDGNSRLHFVIRVLSTGIISLLGFSYLIVLIGVCAYSLRLKRLNDAISSVIFIAINLLIFDSHINGRPRTYFFDTISQISIIYSPLLFIFYAYTIYWGVVVKKHPLAYVAASSIIFCLILSIRQMVDFYNFLPQSLVAVPLMVSYFLSSLRGRIKKFRKNHIVALAICIIIMIAENAFILGNKITYKFSARQNFASKYYFAKELANELKKRNIGAIKAPRNMRYRLLFYGVKNANSPRLIETYGAQNSQIKIIYNKKLVKTYNVKN